MLWPSQAKALVNAVPTLLPLWRLIRDSIWGMWTAQRRRLFHLSSHGCR